MGMAAKETQNEGRDFVAETSSDAVDTYAQDTDSKPRDRLRFLLKAAGSLRRHAPRPREDRAKMPKRQPCVFRGEQ